MTIYSVWDRVAQVWKGIYEATNDADALRAFHDAFANKPHNEDFVLYQIATDWDPQNQPEVTNLFAATRLVYDIQEIPDIDPDDLIPSEEDLKHNG